MSLFTKLYEAVHSWRRRRGGLKSRRRADLAMEQLDHRQLLAVNFTGNAAIDFPVTQSPGVVVIPAPPNNTIPLIPPALQGVINVSGFQINQLRVSYDPTGDTLSVGVEGPPNGRDGRQVIAGDSDNNGNSATVDPNVLAVEPGFRDPADMGQTKTYGIFLDLNNANVTDVVAGFPQGGQFDTAPKPFEVARPIPATPTIPPSVPLFDPNNLLPQYTGNYYLANDPNHPNFELQIAHFSQLYQQFTGKTLTPQTRISIGAFGLSNQNGGISDEYFPPQALSIGAASPTPPTPSLAIVKTTNGVFAPTAPGPSVATGSTVNWNYDVTNNGTEPLKNIAIVDDGGTKGVSPAAFNPVFTGGDTNGNGLLDPGEDWHYIATGVARVGQYENLAAASGVGVTTGTSVLAQTVSHYNATTPISPVCPPTIYVNPHENNHVNTAHPTAVRVSVLGSSGFDPTTLIPSTVRFGDPATINTTGATPILNFERNVNRDQFPDETFVFNGLDVKLPPGLTTAEIIGTTTSGQMIASSVTVFNRDSSFYTQSQINKQQAAFARYDQTHNIPVTNGNFVAPPPVIPRSAQQLAASMAINDLYNPFKGQRVPQQVSAAATDGNLTSNAQAAAVPAPVVAIKTKHGKKVQAPKAHAVSMNVANPSPNIAQMIAGGA